MTKKNKFFIIFLSILPLLVTLALYPTFPDQIPKILNAGTDPWGSKAELLFLPILALATGAFMYYIILKGNKRNYKPFFISTISLLLVKNFLTYMFLHRSYLVIYDMRNIINSSIVLSKSVMVFSSLLILVIGNYMPKTKRNVILGIRTKWALANDEVWNKTHRLAGKLIVLSSFPSILVGLLLSGSSSDKIIVRIWTALLIVPMIIPAIYSKIIYDKLKVKNEL